MALCLAVRKRQRRLDHGVLRQLRHFLSVPPGHRRNLRRFSAQNRQGQPHRPDRRCLAQQQQLGHRPFPGLRPLLPHRVHVKDAFLPPFNALAEFRFLFRNIVRLRRKKLRVVGHVPGGNRVPPAQPAFAQTAEFASFRRLFQFRHHVRFSVPDFRQKSESRQARRLRGQVLRFDLQPLRIGFRPVRTLHRGSSESEAPVSPVQEDRAGPCYRLAQVDHQGLRAVFVHRVAKVQNRLSGPQRMHQPANPAVHPCLVRQARVVLVVAAEGVPVHEEAARRLGIPGINHAVRALKDFPHIPGHKDFSADARVPDHFFPVSRKHLLHRRVAFQNGHFRVRFLPGEKQVG